MKRATLEDIRYTIANGFLTDSDLNEVVDAIKFARKMAGEKIARRISPGTMVKYESGRAGHAMCRGVVHEIRRTRAVVKTEVYRGRVNVMVTVPLNMLQVI